MPPVVAAAAIGGAASLAGGALASRSANKASQLQAQGQDKALAFEREQEAARKAEYDQAKAQYQQQMDAYQQARVAALRHYGVDVPDYTPAGGMGGPQGGAAMGGPRGMRPPMTLGAIAAPANLPQVAAQMGGGPQMAPRALQGGPQGPVGPWDDPRLQGPTIGSLMRQG
jgi:multidrug efflux pump subunit AcrA (membrane-fusion protein)